MFLTGIARAQLFCEVPWYSYLRIVKIGISLMNFKISTCPWANHKREVNAVSSVPAMNHYIDSHAQ